MVYSQCGYAEGIRYEISKNSNGTFTLNISSVLSGHYGYVVADEVEAVIDPNVAEEIIKIIRTHDLGGCTISDVGFMPGEFKAIMDTLSDSKHLEYFCIRKVENCEVDVLVDFLKNCKNLSRVGLQHMDFTVDEGIKIINALSVHSGRLTDIDFFDAISYVMSPALVEKYYDCVATLLQANSEVLENIDFGEGDERQDLPYPTPILKSLQGCKNLKSLSVIPGKYCYGEDEWYQEMLNCLRAGHPKLETVYIRPQDFSNSRLQAIYNIISEQYRGLRSVTFDIITPDDMSICDIEPLEPETIRNFAKGISANPKLRTYDLQVDGIPLLSLTEDCYDFSVFSDHEDCEKAMERIIPASNKLAIELFSILPDNFKTSNKLINDSSFATGRLKDVFILRDSLILKLPPIVEKLKSKLFLSILEGQDPRLGANSIINLLPPTLLRREIIELYRNNLSDRDVLMIKYDMETLLRTLTGDEIVTYIYFVATQHALEELAKKIQPSSLSSDVDNYIERTIGGGICADITNFVLVIEKEQIAQIMTLPQAVRPFFNRCQAMLAKVKIDLACGGLARQGLAGQISEFHEVLSKVKKPAVSVKLEMPADNLLQAQEPPAQRPRFWKTKNPISQGVHLTPFGSLQVPMTHAAQAPFLSINSYLYPHMAQNTSPFPFLFNVDQSGGQQPIAFTQVLVPTQLLIPQQSTVTVQAPQPVIAQGQQPAGPTTTNDSNLEASSASAQNGSSQQLSGPGANSLTDFINDKQAILAVASGNTPSASPILDDGFQDNSYEIIKLAHKILEEALSQNNNNHDSLQKKLSAITDNNSELYKTLKNILQTMVSYDTARVDNSIYHDYDKMFGIGNDPQDFNSPFFIYSSTEMPPISSRFIHASRGTSFKAVSESPESMLFAIPALAPGITGGS